MILRPIKREMARSPACEERGYRGKNQLRGSVEIWASTQRLRRPATEILGVTNISNFSVVGKVTFQKSSLIYIKGKVLRTREDRKLIQTAGPFGLMQPVLASSHSMVEPYPEKSALGSGTSAGQTRAVTQSHSLYQGDNFAGMSSLGETDISRKSLQKNPICCPKRNI